MYTYRRKTSSSCPQIVKKRIRNNEVDDSLFRFNTVYYRPGCVSHKRPGFARHRPDCTDLLSYLMNGKSYKISSFANMSYFQLLLDFILSRPINKPDRYDSSSIQSLPIHLICWIITSALLSECDRPFDDLPTQSEIKQITSIEGKRAIFKYAAVVVGNSVCVSGTKCTLTRACIMEFLYMITRRRPLIGPLDTEFSRFIANVPRHRLLTMSSEYEIRCTQFRFPSEMSQTTVDPTQQVVGVVPRIRETKLYSAEHQHMPITLSDYQYLGFSNSNGAISIFTSWLRGEIPSLRHPTNTPFRTTQSEDRFFRVLRCHHVMRPYTIRWTPISNIIHFAYCSCCGNMSKTESFCESKCFRGTSNPSRCHTPDEPIIPHSGFTVADYTYDTLICVRCNSTKFITLFNIMDAILYIPFYNIYITACTECHRAMRLNRSASKTASFAEFHHHNVCPECNKASKGLPCIYSRLSSSFHPQRLVSIVSFPNGQVPLCKKHRYLHDDDSRDFELKVHNQTTCS